MVQPAKSNVLETATSHFANADIRKMLPEANSALKPDC